MQILPVTRNSMATKKVSNLTHLLITIQVMVVRPGADDDYEEISTDLLSLRGHDRYRPKDYHMDYLQEDKHYFIVSPKGIYAVSSLASIDNSLASTTRSTPISSASRTHSALVSVICVEAWIGRSGQTSRISRTAPRS